MVDAASHLRHSDARARSALLIPWAGFVLAALGGTVLVGWHIGLSSLVRIYPLWSPMQYNTALGMLLSGLGLLALMIRKAGAALVIAAFLMLLGMATLAEYLFGVSLGIDNVIMMPDIASQGPHPGRMGPNSALCFVLVGLSLALLAGNARRTARQLAGQMMALSLLVLSGTALLGHLIGAEQAYGWQSWATMAPHTAGCFLLATMALMIRASERLSDEAPGPLLLLVGGLFAAVFLVDLILPLGFAVGVAYSPLILCALLSARPSIALLLAAVATLMVVLGYIASPRPELNDGTEIVNRGLSLAAVWITAMTVFLHQRAIYQVAAARDTLEMAMEGGRLGLWDWDVASSRVAYSERWCNLVGYRQDELSPDFSTWERLLHPDDFDAAAELASAYAQGKAPDYRSEFRMRHKDGSWRWIQARGKIVERDADGQAARIIGTHLDITEEKARDEQLHRLQTAVNHSESVVLLTEPELEQPVVVYASDSAESVLGRPASDLRGRSLAAVLDINDAASGQRLRAALASERSKTEEFLSHRLPADGGGEPEQRTLRLQIFPIRSDRGDLLHWGAIADDVSAEREATEKLGQEQERFRSVLEYSPIGIALVATDGSWLHANPAVCRIVGYTEDELTDMDFQTITHPDDLQLDLDFLHQMLRGEIESYEMEKRYFHKQGHIVWVLLTVSLVWNANETPRHFISQIQDISKRKENEQKIRQYLEELEKSNQQLDDFAYIASHDLKEPLRAINNHSQSLIKHYADHLDERGQHKLQRLGKLTERMQKLIGDLLYFSRIGRASESKTKIDVGELVKEQVDTLSTLIEEQHASVTLPEPLPSVEADASRLATVFRNLILNGVKYNDSPEKVVAIRGEIGHDESGHPMTIFHVQDNGIGIEPEFHSAIFKMFKRLHGEKVYGEGTGAGLAFVKRIIEQWGGTIWLTSEMGQGTTFHFTIPGAEDGPH